MSDKYVECCKCKHKHYESERVKVRNDTDTKKFGIEITELCCPKCGYNEYYILDKDVQRFG